MAKGSKGSPSSSQMAAQMAQVFADAAKKYAAWSTRIPAATHVVSVDENHAKVVTEDSQAPNAYPYQYKLRHPLNWPNQVNAKHAKSWMRWMGPTPKGPVRNYMTKAQRDVSAIEKAADIGLKKTVEDHWDKD